MTKLIFGFLFSWFMFVSISFASSVNDGFNEYQKGNSLEALELFNKACTKGMQL